MKKTSYWSAGIFLIAFAVMIGTPHLTFSADGGLALGKIALQPTNSPVKTTQASFLLRVPYNLSNPKAAYWFQASPPEKASHAKPAVVPSHLATPNKTSVTLKQVSGGYEADVRASELAPGAYVFYLEFKGNGPATQPAIVVNTAFAIDPSMEVADPGEAGMQTLAGIDSDGDGIRDDVQRWINENYLSFPNVRAALKQLAQDFQTKQLTTADKATSVANIRRFGQSQECFEYIVGGKDSDSIYNKLKEMMLNTRVRILANIQVNVNFNGQTYRLAKRGEEPNLCRFSIKP